MPDSIKHFAVMAVAGFVLVGALSLVRARLLTPSHVITASSGDVLFIPGGSCTVKATSEVDEATFRGYMALCLKAFQATQHKEGK